MAALVVVVVGGAWWLQRDTTSELLTATAIESIAIPSLLLEEPTPLSELSPSLLEAFAEREVRGPLADLEGDASVLAFDGVHVVERDGLVIAIGLDKSGRALCLAEQVAATETTSSRCGSVAGLLRDGVVVPTLSTTKDGQSRTVVFLGEDVVSIEMGDLSALVERNVAVLNTGATDALVARMSDGTSKSLANVPDESVTAELTIDGVTTTEGVTAGCSVVGDDYLVEATFAGEGVLLTATVIPNGVRVSGNLNDNSVDVLTTSADVELSQVEDTLIATATWQAPGSPGSLTINCGQNLIDLSSIR